MAEIPLGQLTNPDHELIEKRLVEAQHGANAVNILLRGGFPRDQARRIRRAQAQEQEHEGDDGRRHDNNN